MKKETLYKWIIGVLIVINTIQLGGFLFAPKPPGSPHKGGIDFREKAIEVLELNAKQTDLFFKSADKHRLTLEELNAKQREIIVIQFNSPSEENLNAIKEIEGQKIKATQINFNEIENILNPGQLSNFKEFKKEALQVIIK